MESRFLGEVAFFEGLSDEELATVEKHLKGVRVPAGKTIFSSGDKGESLFIVRSGSVEAFVVNDFGQQVVLEIMKTGDYFGEASLLDRGPRAGSVMALTDTELLEMGPEDLRHVVHLHPDVALRLMEKLSNRLRASGRLLRHMWVRNVNQELWSARTRIQKLAERVTSSIGSVSFLNLNLLVYIYWLAVNLHWFPAIQPFDPYPFPLLTAAIAMEAVILLVLVLINHERQGVQERIRSDIEYEFNVRTGVEIKHLHEKFDKLSALLELPGAAATKTSRPKAANARSGAEGSVQ